MDCFYEDWINENFIMNHLQNSKKVCIVSPDLHKREYLHIWETYKSMSIVQSENLMICTDFPEKAREFLKYS